MPLSLKAVNSVASANTGASSVDGSLKVICAWPVSGSYGAGSRVLFYVLVATAVFAQKLGWIKSAALSTALPLSASAAVHGIVLAALHRDKAVDMDVYGAFQMCAIGTLVVPPMIKLSSSYEYSTYIGRRIMFMWAGLVLTGMHYCSLTLVVDLMIGTGLPALGSLYILLARDGDVASQEPQPDTNHDGIGCQHCCEHGNSDGSSATNASSRDGDEASQNGIHMGATSGGRGSPRLLKSNDSSDNGNKPSSSAARITKTSRPTVSSLEASSLPS